MKKFYRLHGSCIVTIRVSVNCSKRPEVLLAAINNPRVEWHLLASMVKYCFHIKGIENWTQEQLLEKYLIFVQMVVKHKTNNIQLYYLLNMLCYWPENQILTEAKPRSISDFWVNNTAYLTSNRSITVLLYNKIHVLVNQ